MRKNFREQIKMGKSAYKKHKLMEQLRRSLDAEAFLRDVMGAVNIEQDGDEYKHSCLLPFGLHSGGDANPSASFNAEKLAFNCFVCGGGDIFWFIQNVKDCSQQTAKAILSELIGPTEFSSQELIATMRSFWAEEDTAFSIPTYSERIIKPWVKPLQYFDERGISRHVQETMKTGIDINNKDKLKIKTTDGSKKEIIMDQPRVIIPHFWKGKLVGWSKRKIDDEQMGGKYKHSVSFPATETLFGYDQAKNLNDVIVVESPMSVLRMYSEGVMNVVATFGAEVSDDQAWLLRRWDNVVLFFDGDAAGRKATSSTIERLHQHTNVFVAPIEEEHDPGDLTKGEIESAVRQKELAVLWG